MLGEKAKLGEYNEPLGANHYWCCKRLPFAILTKKIEPEEHVLSKDYELSFMFKIKAGHIPNSDYNN